MGAVHGSAERYDEGCRCSGCVIAACRRDVEAKRELKLSPPVAPNPFRGARGPRRPRPPRVTGDELRGGQLAVECWCRAAVIYVDPSVIRARQTGSCGAQGCTPSALVHA